ncbi:MAG: serine hydrolase domain-containing protein [Hyphomonadaceae bacterium]
MAVTTISRRQALLGAGALAGLGLAGCGGASNYDAPYVPGYRETQRLIERYVREGKVAGASVVLKTLNAAPMTLSAGRVSLESGAAAAAEDTIWRVYSMSKPITGIAAMILIQDGRLALDQPIGEIVPAFANMRVLANRETMETRPARTQITVRHLLTHTAGFSYTIINEPVLSRLYRQHGLFAAGRQVRLEEGDGQPPATLEEFGERLAALPLSYEPGAWWRYSVSLDVLGLVIQRASGVPFDQFLERRLFRPLSMSDTGFYVPQQKLSRFATNYIVEDGRLQVLDDHNNSAFANAQGVPYGGAGIVSTARDYARFCEMLLNGGALDGQRVLSRENVRIATTNLLPEGIDRNATGLEGADFGAGMGIVTEASARPGEAPPGAYSWGGAAGTTMWVDPVNAAYVVGMTQYMPSNAYPIWRELREAAYRDFAALRDPNRRALDITDRPRRNF